MKKEIRKELRVIQEKERELKLKMNTKSVYVSKKNRKVDETLEKLVSDSSHESFKYQQQMSMIDLTGVKGVEVCEEVKEVNVAEQYDNSLHELSAGGGDNEGKEYEAELDIEHNLFRRGSITP